MIRTPLTGLVLLGAGLLPWPGLAQEVPRNLPRPVMAQEVPRSLPRPGLAQEVPRSLPRPGLAQEVPRSLPRPTGGWIGLAVDFSQISLRGVPQTAAIITQVVSGSPAEAAGIQAGDTLLRLDGQSVSEKVFAALPGTLQPGDLVRLTISREGRAQDVMVEAAPRPSPFPAMAPNLREMAVRLDTIRGAILQNLDSLRLSIAELRPGAFWPGTLFTSPDSAIPFEFFALRGPVGDSLRNEILRLRQEVTEVRRQQTSLEAQAFSRGISGSPIILGQSVMLGAHLAPLNPDLAAVFSVPEGVFVIQVPAGTPASDAGLMGGDIIVRVGDDEVASLTDLRFGLGTREGTIRMQVIRRGQPVEIVVRR